MNRPRQLDIFGAEGRTRLGGSPDAYAAAIGTGPAGETCSTCSALLQFGGSRTYYKCGRGRLSHGAATDISPRAPACRLWQRQATEGIEAAHLIAVAKGFVGVSS